MFEEKGIYDLSSRFSAVPFFRHSTLHDTTKYNLSAAEILEPWRIGHDDGKRPEGITLIP